MKWDLAIYIVICHIMVHYSLVGDYQFFKVTYVCTISYHVLPKGMKEMTVDFLSLILVNKS
jgi:hypothetical protein